MKRRGKRGSIFDANQLKILQAIQQKAGIKGKKRNSFLSNQNKKKLDEGMPSSSSIFKPKLKNQKNQKSEIIKNKIYDDSNIGIENIEQVNKDPHNGKELFFGLNDHNKNLKKNEIKKSLDYINLQKIIKKDSQSFDSSSNNSSSSEEEEELRSSHRYLISDEQQQKYENLETGETKKKKLEEEKNSEQEEGNSDSILGDDDEPLPQKI